MTYVASQGFPAAAILVQHFKDWMKGRVALLHVSCV